MSCLAKHVDGSKLTSAEIAGLTKVPQGYLSKVLKQLNRAGLVTSARGPGGGHELARPPMEVTILDVVNAVDPFQRINACPLGLVAHRANLCRMHRSLDDAMGKIEDALRSTTLSDVGHLGRGNAGLCPGPGGQILAMKSRKGS